MEKRSLMVTCFVLIIILAACRGNSPTPSPSPIVQASSTPIPSITESPIPDAGNSTPSIPVENELADPTPVTAVPDNPAGGGSDPTPTGAGSPTAIQPVPSEMPAQPVAGNLAQPDCLDQAAFVADITVPDGTILRPGEKFIKTWRVKNTGSCNWGSGYSLAFHSGDMMNGLLNPPIDPVRAGEVGDVSVELTSPTRGGMQIGNWVFQNSAGKRFGLSFTGNDPMWVQINVAFLNEAGTPTGFQPAPQVGVGTTGSEPLEQPANPSLGAPVATEDSEEVSSTSGPVFANCRYTQNQAYIDELLRLINQERKNNGLGPVFLQEQLSQAALKHSADMACNRFVGHNGSDGSTWYDRVRTQGYTSSTTARENIYVGDPQFGGNASGAFNWWMGSQVHRDNILFPTVTEVGIGYVYLAGSPQGGYYTLVLARR